MQPQTQAQHPYLNSNAPPQGYAVQQNTHMTTANAHKAPPGYHPQ